MSKKRTFSGVKPSNEIHLGNYFGAIKNWVEMQDEYECIFSIVDFHALTVYQKPEDIRKNIFNIAKTYLALGIDPKKSLIFQQSDVKEHTELCWILNTIAKVGEMERMTQFKDKAKEHPENINVGLFDYPVLMAADIFLYDTQAVPVGDDQKQHVELARDLAIRFNSLYGETFVIPEPVIKKEGRRIMGLDNPLKKMSKTASSTLNYISLVDDPEVAKKKIIKAVTDSGNEIKYAEDKPALCNLLTIYSLLTGELIKNIEEKYTGKGYGDFKKDLADIVADFLVDFQKKFNKISDKEVKKILEDGADKARKIAAKKMEEVKQKIGIKI